MRSRTITFESNWQKAKSILEKVLDDLSPSFTDTEKRELQQLATRYFIKLGKMTPIVYTSVVENGIQLTMRYLTPARERRNVERTMWERVLADFGKEDDIAFAYRTQRVFYNPNEGRPGVGGSGQPMRRHTLRSFPSYKNILYIIIHSVPHV